MKAQMDFGRLGINSQTEATLRGGSGLTLGTTVVSPLLWIPQNFICISFVSLFSVFFKEFYISCLFLVTLGLRCCVMAFSSFSEWRAHYSGFSCWSTSS